MRVIAGALKGRRLGSPRWPGLRPTSDRLRETLFNVLGDRVEGARVVDGYAGSGALGIEALSRGAARVIFIEADRRAAGLIAENLDRCGVGGGYAIIRAPFARAWRRASLKGRFDLILLDPPYDEADLEAPLALAARHLGPRGLIVLEHARRRAPGAGGADLERFRAIRSGDSVLTVYRLAHVAATGRTHVEP